MTLAVVLLAAGQSERFGAENKLLQLLQGRPLISHSVDQIRELQPGFKIVVTNVSEIAALLPDFDWVKTDETKPMMSQSIRHGIQAAQAAGATKALILLADMPFIAAKALEDVVSNCTDDLPSATTDGVRALPPACFPRSMFSDLMMLNADNGAAHLLKGLPPRALVSVSAAGALDIDTKDALKAAQDMPVATPAGSGFGSSQ